MKTEHTRRLVEILQLAYSGELAACFAYRGHACSVDDLEVRERIQAIEQDEWRHRHHVGEMLAALGARPSRVRELRAAIVGRSLGLACHLAGWFAPMYGAGKLESRNIGEYETAARLARDAGHHAFVEPLLEMAEVEWEHERFFRACVERHPWSRWLRPWPAPASLDRIRASFADESPSALAPVYDSALP